jgi:hypothetical protein
MEGIFLLAIAGVAIGSVFCAVWWALAVLFSFAAPNEMQVVACVVLFMVATPTSVGLICFWDELTQKAKA